MLVNTIIFTAPLLLIASFIGATAVLIALATGNVLSGIYAAILMRRDLSENDHPIANISPLDAYKADFLKVIKLGR